VSPITHQRKGCGQQRDGLATLEALVASTNA
jgi:hypothetical protein